MSLVLKVLAVLLLFTIIPFNQVIVAKKRVSGNQVCYPPWGCFNKQPPFHNPLLFFYLPEAPSQIHTKMKLHIPSKSGGVRLSMKNPQTNDISAGDKVVVLVHGLTDRMRNSGLSNMRAELLNRRNQSGQKYLKVIMINWTGGVKVNSELQSFSNGRLVAAQIAHLIVKLKALNSLSCDDVHIIGLSLGASVAGLAGKEAKKSSCVIGRITGLDPVYTYTTQFQAIPNGAKLHSTDAAYVDVIHTHTSYTGRVGNVDFYPNGGSNTINQPGCTTSGCSHLRSAQLFTSTIQSQNDCCLATKCTSYAQFTANNCANNHKRKMGFAHGRSTVPNSDGKYFFNTGSTAPYCVCGSGSSSNSGSSTSSGSSSNSGSSNGGGKK